MADERGKSVSSPARLAANRRNAQKCTGPRTAAGKRRAALNSQRRGLAPPEIERQLQDRGENPHDFRGLHRDLVALFPPHEASDETAVRVLAETRSLRSGQAVVGEGSSSPRLGRGGQAPNSRERGHLARFSLLVSKDQERARCPRSQDLFGSSGLAGPKAKRGWCLRFASFSSDCNDSRQPWVKRFNLNALNEIQSISPVFSVE